MKKTCTRSYLHLTRFSFLPILLVIIFGCPRNAYAFSFNIDSIAGYGKFPKFCVDVYHWGDRFFNTYDSTYVQGTGYNMNVKMRSNSWYDASSLTLPDGTDMSMVSPSTTTIGFDVTYLAVSLGYDININKLFGAVDRTKSKFNFDFSCALLSASFYSIKNDVGMYITKFGDISHIKENFKGISTSEWGFDVNYFFNNKRYSYAAAFSFSKLQRKSQGSFSLGLAYSNQRYNIDFTQLPATLYNQTDYINYRIKGQSVGIKAGYGYNWVPRRNITIGISESLIPSLMIGYMDSDSRKCSFRLVNRLNISFVWNYKRWFIGAAFKSDISIVRNKSSIIGNALFNSDIKIGWRFNL